MASFQTHITFGIALGMVGAMGFVALALAPDQWILPVLIGLAVIIGAILPDMDSDTGIPFHVTFGSLALISGGLALAYALKNFPNDVRYLVGLPFGVLFSIWVILGSIFKKFTIHRGMAHSIPAALLAAFITYSFATRVGFSLQDAFYLGSSMGLGYLLHLILDELNSLTNFQGRPFIPNKALGSALKFTSASTLMNFSVYGSLIFLLLANGNDLLTCWHFFSAKITHS